MGAARHRRTGEGAGGEHARASTAVSVPSLLQPVLISTAADAAGKARAQVLGAGQHELDRAQQPLSQPPAQRRQQDFFAPKPPPTSMPITFTLVSGRPSTPAMF